MDRSVGHRAFLCMWTRRSADTEKAHAQDTEAMRSQRQEFVIAGCVMRLTSGEDARQASETACICHVSLGISLRYRKLDRPPRPHISVMVYVAPRPMLNGGAQIAGLAFVRPLYVVIFYM